MKKERIARVKRLSPLPRYNEIFTPDIICKTDRGTAVNINDLINRSELNERLDGDISLFRDLLEIFTGDYPRLRSEIIQAIDDGDSEKLGKRAHTVKGAVSNFSAISAYQAALNLEKTGKSGDLSSAGENLKKLEEAVDETIKALQVISDSGSIL